MAKITSQAVGAYGERVVEAELLRNHWIPANINASVRNAADFDIYAKKNERQIHIRVKTCGPSLRQFQYGFKKGEPVSTAGLSDLDFSVLVSMGESRSTDEFYVLPTGIVRQALNDHRSFYLSRTKRDGNQRKDTGHWSLRLFRDANGNDPGYDLGQRWQKYQNNWALLDG
jgi:hypothetical protein